MCKEMCVIAEDVKNSKLLALFNTLEESDKDVVIKMSELLVERCELNIINVTRSKVVKTVDYINC